MDILSNALNLGLSTDTIYLDFAKALDRIPQAGKLERMGIFGNLLLWSKSFLANRKQRVVMGNNINLWKIIAPIRNL